MTRSLSSLKVIMQNVLDAKPWVFDPRVTPIPWREDIYQEVQLRPLTIGVLVDDGVVKVHPPIGRVLRDLETKLRAAGHDIIAWDPSHHRECIEIMVSQSINCNNMGYSAHHTT
jgi:amidase